MKLLRVGKKNEEFVVALDKNEKLRNLSNHIKDLNPDTINFKILKDLKNNKFEITLLS